MSNELNETLINVKTLINSVKFSRKIERIQEEYNRISEPDIHTVIGHALSSTSFKRFENTIKRHTSDQDEDFRQYLNKLMFEKDITQTTISRRSLIKGAALSRYINGSREVKKYVVFRIALSLKLNLVETETLLRKVGKGFKETRMDGVIIESIEQGIYDVIKVEAILHRFTDGEESLFTKREQEELSFNEEDLEIEIF